MKLLIITITIGLLLTFYQILSMADAHTMWFVGLGVAAGIGVTVWLQEEISESKNTEK